MSKSPEDLDQSIPTPAHPELTIRNLANHDQGFAVSDPEGSITEGGGSTVVFKPTTNEWARLQISANRMFESDKSPRLALVDELGHYLAEDERTQSLTQVLTGPIFEKILRLKQIG